MKKDKPNQNIESIFISLDSIFNSNKDDSEIEKEVLTFFDYHIMKDISFNQRIDFQNIINRTKEISHRYNKILLILKRTTDNYIKTIENTIKETKYDSDFKDNYPKFVSPKHPNECILFYDEIKNIEKGKGFSILKGSELLDISRQTLSKWIKEEKFGIKRKKSNKISLEELYIYKLNILINKNK
jgi:hypothetical protein